MEENKVQIKHVQVPDPTDFKDLKPTDRLVYANIRRFMNKDTYECYPSMQTIASKCGITKDTVAASIKRLVKWKYIEIKPNKHGKNNVYKFLKLDKDFERFTEEFLDNEKISSNEKAYLIGLQSQCYKSGGYALTTYSNKQIAEHLNMSLRSVNRYNTSLKTKEIMTELQTSKCDEEGFRKVVKAIELAKIGQQVLFEIAVDHEDRLQDLEKENKDLKVLVKILFEKVDELQKKDQPKLPETFSF